MAIWPVILVNDTQSVNDDVLINHERIHLRQQAELLVIPFYIFYLFNYLINLIIYREHYRAYRQILFEREAYKMEADLRYLDRRKWYNWVSYF